MVEVRTYVDTAGKWHIDIKRRSNYFAFYAGSKSACDAILSMFANETKLVKHELADIEVCQPLRSSYGVQLSLTKGWHLCMRTNSAMTSAWSDICTINSNNKEVLMHLFKNAGLTLQNIY